MFVNIIKSCRDVVAVCDSDLIGKYFEEGESQLNVKENFYRGEDVSREKAIEIMKNMKMEDATFNIVGKESVSAAIEAEIISEDGISRIQGIPFIFILI